MSCNHCGDTHHASDESKDHEAITTLDFSEFTSDFKGDHESLQTLETLVRKGVEFLISGDYEQFCSTHDSIKDIVFMLNGSTLVDIDMETFSKIHQFLNVSFIVEEREEEGKNIITVEKTYTFGELLKHFFEEHIHEHNCYHKESLIVHLFLCMCNTYSYCTTDTTIDSQRRLVLTLTSLFHDCGKECTKNTFFSKTRGCWVTGFAYHSIMGAMMLILAYTPAFDEIISNEEYGLMCCLVSTHMCGYGSGENDQKTNILRILTASLHDNLRILGISDKRSMISAKDEDQASYLHDNQELCDWLKNNPHSLGSLRESLGVTGNGILITLLGKPRSGKSTTSRKFKIRFGERVVVVSRDDMILTIGRELLGNSEATYTQCYQRCRQKNVRNVIDQRMQEIIDTELDTGKIVILDTCKTLGDFKCYESRSVKNSLRFNIHCVRQQKITESDCEYVQTVDELLKTMGKKSFLEILSVFGGWSLSGPRGSNMRNIQMFAELNNDAVYTESLNPVLTIVNLAYPFEGHDLENPLMNHLLALISEDCSQSEDCEEEKKEEKEQTLEEFMNLNFSSGNFETVKEFFRGNFFSCSQVNSDIPAFVLKYMDGCNHDWSLKGIQSRSCLVFYLDGEWTVWYAMPRGPETILHKDDGFDSTQDFDSDNQRDLAKFRKDTQKIIRFMNGMVDDDNRDFVHTVYLTGKRDGSCGRFWTFMKESKEFGIFIDHFLPFIEDEFTLKFINYTLEDSNRNYVVLPASNGTFVNTYSPFHETLASSIAVSYGIINFSDLDKFSVLDLEVEGISVIERFFTDFDSIIQPQHSYQVHCFELVVPNRTCPLNGQEQVELAVSYSWEDSGITYLGYSTTSEGNSTWTPHYEVSHLFDEPIVYQVTPEKVREMLFDLASVATDEEFSLDNFKAEFAPFCINRSGSKVRNPDLEGFVMYVNGIYMKAKTSIYYKLHKIRSGDVGTIINLPEKCGYYFPIQVSIKNFFESNLILDAIQNLHFRSLDDSLLEQIENMKPKALQALERKRREGDNHAYRNMILNMIGRERFAEIVLDIFSNSLDVSHIDNKQKESLSRAVKSIVCCGIIMVGTDDWEERFAGNVSHEDLFCLFRILINQAH